MTDRIELLLEAERRGILPADKAPFLEEARARGLVPPAEGQPATGPLPDTVPPEIRTVVGSKETPALRQQALQQYYPGATVTPTEGDNFDITQGGQTIPYNPSGLDWGDVASIAPEAGQMAGGTIGSALGFGSAGPVGAVVGGGLGAAAGDRVVRNLITIMTGTPNPPVSEQVQHDALTTMLNAGGEAFGRLFGEATSAVFRRMLAGGSQGIANVKQALDDAAAWEVQPSVGQATGSRFWRGVEALAPDKLKEQVQREAAKVGQRIATQTGRPEQAVVGQALKEGIEGYRYGTMNATGYALDNAFLSQLPLNTPITLTNSIRAVNDLAGGIPGLTNVNRETIATPMGRLGNAILQDMSATGQLPLEAVRSLRQKVGDIIKSPQAIEGYSIRDLRTLYGAMSDDIRAAASAQGPGVLAAFERANKYWNDEFQKIEEITGPLLAKGIPEKLAKAVNGSLKDGSSVVDEIRRVTTPAQFNLLRNDVLNRLGEVAPGQELTAEGGTWSFDKFLANWTALGARDRRTRNILFGQSQYAQDLDRLARTSARLHSAKGEANVPRYAAAGLVGGAAIGGATLGGPVGGALGGLAGWLALPAGFALTSAGVGKTLINNPGFVRWLADTTATKPSGLGAAFGRLAAVTAQNPEIKDDVRAFLEVFSEQPIVRAGMDAAKSVRSMVEPPE